MAYQLKTASSVILVLLLTYFNMYSIKTRDTDTGRNINYYSTNKIDSTITSPPITYDSFIVKKEGHDVLYERYFNYETQEFAYNTKIIERELNHFDINLPPQLDINLPPQLDIEVDSNIFSQGPILLEPAQELNINTAFEYDHFSDFTREERQQTIREMEEQELQKRLQEAQSYSRKQAFIIREQGFKNERLNLGDPRKFDSEIILDKVYTNLQQILNHPIIHARFVRLTHDFENKPIKRGRGEKEYNYNNELKFLNELCSGKVAALCDTIHNADLATAQIALNELKDLWPWPRDYSFVIPNLIDGTGESGFIAILGIDIVKIAERDFITRSDYIAAHMDENSRALIQAFKEECIGLQKKNDTSSLFNIKQKLFKTALENGRQTDLINNICLAIAEKIYLDPINTTLNRIKHAPSLETAQKQVLNLEKQLFQYAKDQNITAMDDIKAKIIERYGFDVLHIAHETYRARPDYVHTPNNQSFLSDSLAPILCNIQEHSLPMAYAELIHVQKQIKDALQVRNITDPIEQKKRIIKDFGVDVLEITHEFYMQRPDHINIINHFLPLEVQKITAEILENNYSYLAVAQEFNKVADQILDNAKLCQLECVPQVEDQILDSLQIMQEPKNNAEFIFHTTIVDHLLTDLQSQSTAVVEGKPINWERATNLLCMALGQFISRLNPITQAEDLGSLFIGASYLLDGGVNKVLDSVIEEIHDPIGTSKQYAESALLACQYIIDTARFTCNAISGAYYLSPEERCQRLENYCKNAKEIYRHIESQVTAEQIAAATGHILGDFVFGLGVSSAAVFLKEIDAFGKISNEAKVIAQGLKSAIEEHPSFVTAEGIVLKMSHDTKDIGRTIKTAYNSIMDTKNFSNLKSIGENIWQSPAGIIYGDDRKFGNTLNHMLAHMTPNSTKKVHTVFSVPENKMVELIDEAWMLKGNPLPLDQCAYLVDMKRIIGTKEETVIRIIVKEPGTAELLTAYPVMI